jgi:hypothetical protein
MVSTGVGPLRAPGHHVGERSGGRGGVRHEVVNGGNPPVRC